jgi:DNA-binding transcriptional ArsR family regulator
MREAEKLLKAFANRRRLRIVQFIKAKKEAPVGDISHEIGLSFKSTSRHLSVLAGCEILDREQRSSQVFYRIAPIQKPIARYLISTL